MTNKQLARRWFNEIWNQSNPAIINELMAPSVTAATEGGVISGPDDFRTLVYEPLKKAFPDLRIVEDGLIAEGEDVVVKWTIFATHKGDLMELTATGRSVRFSGMTWLRFQDGKIVAGSDSFNFHGLMAYLASGEECTSVGCIPPSRSAESGAS